MTNYDEGERIRVTLEGVIKSTWGTLRIETEAGFNHYVYPGDDGITVERVKDPIRPQAGDVYRTRDGLFFSRANALVPLIARHGWIAVEDFPGHYPEAELLYRDETPYEIDSGDIS